MKIISGSVKETISIGKSLALSLQKGDIVCLFGDLGSGKTVLTKGISSGLGVKPGKILSPTFVLLRRYGGKVPVYHFDLYRLNDPKDILGIGYEEYFFDEGISVIEWADRLGYYMPKEFLKIKLEISGEKRRTLKFTATGRHYRRLLEKLNEDIGG
jgi:tRNA threonylcarbamoyladenosine biosynthesis protein TsaE